MISARRLLGSVVMLGSGTAMLHASVSCIIPDHGIVALVDCGARWCASAPFAEALNTNGERIQVQQANPDGSTGWVVQCRCMTPDEDLVLLNASPHLQYELLRSQIVDGTREACIDVAIANDLDPDPPVGNDEILDPDCYEAVTSIYRDGCCTITSDQCGGSNSCDGPDTGGPDTGGPDTDPGDPTDGADDTTGEGALPPLDPFYDHIACDGTTCHIGQPLIDALLANPEAALAEGTSLTLHPIAAPTGLRLHGVEPGGLAHLLGLREGDQILRIDGLPLTTQTELFDAAAHAYEADAVTISLRRGRATHDRHFVRVR